MLLLLQLGSEEQVVATVLEVRGVLLKLRRSRCEVLQRLRRRLLHVHLSEVLRMILLENRMRCLHFVPSQRCFEGRRNVLLLLVKILLGVLLAH